MSSTLIGGSPIMVTNYMYWMTLDWKGMTLDWEEIIWEKLIIQGTVFTLELPKCIIFEKGVLVTIHKGRNFSVYICMLSVLDEKFRTPEAS